MSEAADTPEKPADESASEAPKAAATAVATPPAATSDDSVETAPCYACGSTRGVPAGYRWWGPGALMGEVRCVDCGTYYNKKTGQSNGPWILWWHMFAFLIGVSAVSAWLLTR